SPVTTWETSMRFSRECGFPSTSKKITQAGKEDRAARIWEAETIQMISRPGRGWGERLSTRDKRDRISAPGRTTTEVLPRAISRGFPPGPGSWERLSGEAGTASGS